MSPLASESWKLVPLLTRWQKGFAGFSWVVTLLSLVCQYKPIQVQRILTSTFLSSFHFLLSQVPTFFFFNQYSILRSGFSEKSHLFWDPFRLNLPCYDSPTYGANCLKKFGTLRKWFSSSVIQRVTITSSIG